MPLSHPAAAQGAVLRAAAEEASTMRNELLETFAMSTDKIESQADVWDARFDDRDDEDPVSYTHLTLPTILLV